MATIRTVLVHGAGGVQGGAIARRLGAEGFTVRGATRRPAAAAAMRAVGIEVVAADLADRDQLRRACVGMDAVALTVPMEWHEATAVTWARNAVGAARDSGVGLVVLNASSRIPAEATDVPAFEIHRRVEAVVLDSGVPAIALRPTVFLENLASPGSAPAITRDHVVAYPLPAGLRASWMAVDDLGGFVAAALRRPDLAGRAIDIGGPEPLDGAGLAGALGAAVGRALRYQRIPADALETALAAVLGADVARGIAGSYRWTAGREDSDLMIGAGELAGDVARPLVDVTTWARAQPWLAPAAAP